MWYLITIAIHFPIFGPVQIRNDIPKTFIQKEDCLKEIKKDSNVLSGCFFREDNE